MADRHHARQLASLIAAGMSGDQAMLQAVDAEATLSDMELRIRTLGGSDVDVEEAQALVRAKLVAQQATPAPASVRQAVDEVLRPWMTGEKRPSR